LNADTDLPNADTDLPLQLLANSVTKQELGIRMKNYIQLFQYVIMSFHYLMMCLALFSTQQV